MPTRLSCAQYTDWVQTHLMQPSTEAYLVKDDEHQWLLVQPLAMNMDKQIYTKNDPSTRPQTEFLCKPIRRIMEEKSMTRNHEGEIIGRGII